MLRCVRPWSTVATANIPGFRTASGFGTRASTMKDRDSAEIAGLIAVIRPENDRPWNASTLAITFWPIAICPAWTPGMVSRSRTGLIFSRVTTAVDGCTYSPSETFRSLM